MLLHPPRGSSRAARRSLVAAAIAATSALALPALAPAAEPLPGGRVIELVSPPDTNNESARPGGFLASGPLSGHPLIFPDGRMAFSQLFSSVFPETGNGWGAIWQSVRTPARWEQTSLEPPIPEQQGRWHIDLFAATSDLSRTLLRRMTLRSVFAEGPTYRFRGPTVLEVRDASGERTTIASVPWPEDVVNKPPLEFVGWSDDLRAVTFSTTERLAGPAVEPGIQQVYLWRDGKVQVASDAVGPRPDPTCGGASGSSLPEPTTRLMSADGSVAYFALYDRDPVSGFCSVQRLMVRDGDRLWQVDSPEPGVPVTPGATTGFLGTVPDGRTAYIATGAALTADDANSISDLYRFDLPAGGGTPSRTCITCAYGGTDGVDVPQVQTGQISADGSTVFFRAVQSIDGQGADRPPGSFEYNLFALRDGKIRLVSDRAGLTGFGHLGNVNVTPDGRTMLFRSRANLTSTDIGGTSQLYRATLGADGTYGITCISCDPGGAPPSGDVAAGGTTRASFISDDGRTIQFASNDALTPTAVAGLTNLYVWEDGKLGLIHTGLTTRDPIALGVSPDGDDVVFDAYGALTHETEQTTDSIYTARRGGGFAAPVLPPAPCSGDGCRGVPTPQPTLPAAATVAFGGGEDDRPAPSGKVRTRKPVVRGTSVRVDVAAPAAGRLSITGERVRSLSRTVTKEGTARMAVQLTSDARKVLARRKRVKVTLKVTFRPAAGGGAASSARLTVTVKR